MVILDRVGVVRGALPFSGRVGQVLDSSGSLQIVQLVVWSYESGVSWCLSVS